MKTCLFCCFTQLMLSLAKGLFEEQSDLEKLIMKIMMEARDLLCVERCGVYLVDDNKSKENKVFQVYFKVQHKCMYFITTNNNYQSINRFEIIKSQQSSSN